MNVWEVAPRDVEEPAEAADEEYADLADDDADADGDATEGAIEGATDSAPDAPGEPPAEDEVTPLGIDPPGDTGDAVVDRAVRRLTQVDYLATDQHGEVYEDVHRELREVLAGLDR
ncbi:MAG: hypothetical protein HOV68_02580 [Streptomycetaceae bacterium]|nr:hypothetical protein [Streptomycetaceae bacterium]